MANCGSVAGALVDQTRAPANGALERPAAPGSAAEVTNTAPPSPSVLELAAITAPCSIAKPSNRPANAPRPNPPPPPPRRAPVAAGELFVPPATAPRLRPPSYGAV